VGPIVDFILKGILRRVRRSLMYGDARESVDS
jgi:hypothetical protein